MTAKAGQLRGSLPFMKTVEEAIGLCKKERDNFYLDAFMFEAWLGRLALDVAAECAENKSANERHLQAGEARRGFQHLFGGASDQEFPVVFNHLLRFAEYDDCQSEQIRRAFWALSIEEPPSEPRPFKPPLLRLQRQEIISRMRHSVERLCDWLDALLHFQAHFQRHVLPESFDPDPEKRELAALGTNQRFYGKLSAFSKAWWQWHHGEAAQRFKDSPKWPTIGKIMSTPLRKDALPATVDNVVITIWPLVKRHNWTYRDLMAVVQRILPARHDYPLEREQDLTAYCNNVLGLRKPPGPAGKSSPDGKPPGYQVALRLCGHDAKANSS